MRILTLRGAMMALLFVLGSGDAFAQNAADWTVGSTVLDQSDLSAYSASGPEDVSIVQYDDYDGAGGNILLMAVSANVDDNDSNCPDGVYEIFLFSSTDGTAWTMLGGGPVIERSSTTLVNSEADAKSCGAKVPNLGRKAPSKSNQISLSFVGMQVDDLCAQYTANGWTAPTWGCENWSSFITGGLRFDSAGALIPLSGGDFHRNKKILWDAVDEADGYHAVRDTATGTKIILYEEFDSIIRREWPVGASWSSATTVMVPGDAGTASWDDDVAYNPALICTAGGDLKAFTGGQTFSGALLSDAGWSPAISSDFGTTWSWGQDAHFQWSSVNDWLSWDAVKVGDLGDNYVTWYENVVAAGTHEIVIAYTDPNWAVDDVQTANCTEADCWMDIAVTGDSSTPNVASLKVNGEGSDTYNSTAFTAGSGYYSQTDGGHGFFCMVDSTGSVVCERLTTDRQDLVDGVPLSGSWQYVTSGNNHACALDDAGTIDCWGDDGHNQVTDTPLGAGYLVIGAGNAVTCAINSLNGLECWGLDAHNEVTDMPTTGTYSDVDCGREYCVAVDAADGHLVIWGTPLIDAVILNLPGDLGFVSVDAGKYNALALDGSGALTAWGNNANNIVDQVMPGGIYGDVTWVNADMSNEFGCGIVDDPGTSTLAAGDVQCWGRTGSPLAHEDAADGCL